MSDRGEREEVDVSIIAFNKSKEHEELCWLLDADHSKKMKKMKQLIKEELVKKGVASDSDDLASINDKDEFQSLCYKYEYKRHDLINRLPEKSDLIGKLGQFNKWFVRCLPRCEIVTFSMSTTMFDQPAMFRFSYKTDSGSNILFPLLSYLPDVLNGNTLPEFDEQFGGPPSKDGGIDLGDLSKNLHAYVDYKYSTIRFASRKIITPDGRELFVDEDKIEYDDNWENPTHSNPEFGKKSLDDFIKEDYEKARIMLSLHKDLLYTECGSDIFSI